MDKQAFMLLAGLMITVLGIGYIVSERFAFAYFYKLNAFGKRDLFMNFIPEATGVFVVRFVLGPILFIVGFRILYADL